MSGRLSATNRIVRASITPPFREDSPVRIHKHDGRGK